MFGEESAQKLKPWYRRTQVLVAAAIIVVVAVAVVMFVRSRRDQNTEAHYNELERQRAEQQAAHKLSVEEEIAAAEAEAQALAQEGAAAAPEGEAAAQSATAETTGMGAPPPRRHWTSFRGTNRDGRYVERAVKTAWPAEGPPLLWKQPVGGGYASFSIADGVAYTIEQRRGQEVVAAYRVTTGRELWTNKWNAEFNPGDSTGNGPRATPTWDEGRVYALGGTGEFRCLDAKTGRVIWSKNILSDNGASNLQWGMAASPLVVDDKVVVLAGGPGNKSVVAYNKLTGERVWGSMSDPASYTSPMLVNLAGRRQILVVTGKSVAGLDPNDGAVLWSHPWPTSMGINASQPIVVNANRFFISAGYSHGASLIEIANAGGGFAARTVWENSLMKNKFNSSVLHEGHIYGLDEGRLKCLDVQTGERKWQGPSYGYGQVILASGHLIITTEEGEVVLVRATPEAHTEVARFKAFDAQTWNVPAIADGRLLVRNAKEMACYNLTE